MFDVKGYVGANRPPHGDLSGSHRQAGAAGGLRVL